MSQNPTPDNSDLIAYDRRRSDARMDTLEGRIKALDLTMRLKFEALNDTLDALHAAIENVNHDRRVHWRLVVLVVFGIMLGDIAIIFSLWRWLVP